MVGAVRRTRVAAGVSLLDAMKSFCCSRRDCSSLFLLILGWVLIVGGLWGVVGWWGGTWCLGLWVGGFGSVLFPDRPDSDNSDNNLTKHYRVCVHMYVCIYIHTFNINFSASELKLFLAQRNKNNRYDTRVPVGTCVYLPVSLVKLTTETNHLCCSFPLSSPTLICCQDVL
jgi:hypothetical protein